MEGLKYKFSKGGRYAGIALGVVFAVSIFAQIGKFMESGKLFEDDIYILIINLTFLLFGYYLATKKI